MIPQELQSLLSSPTPVALIGHVYSRQDWRGIVARNRLFVITGFHYTPPISKKAESEEEPMPRCWLTGYTVYDDHTVPRPFNMLLDSLFNEQRYRPTDMMIDPKTGKSPEHLEITVHTNKRPVRSKKPEVTVRHA